MFAFDGFSKLPSIVSRPPLPARPTAALPEAVVVWYSVEPMSISPCSLLTMAIATSPMFRVCPFESVAAITAVELMAKLSYCPLA
jgi:hypothetical protein